MTVRPAGGFWGSAHDGNDGFVRQGAYLGRTTPEAIL